VDQPEPLPELSTVPLLVPVVEVARSQVLLADSRHLLKVLLFSLLLVFWLCLLSKSLILRKGFINGVDAARTGGGVLEAERKLVRQRLEWSALEIEDTLEVEGYK